VVVTGASGFVGRRLCSMLLERGHEVVTAVRTEAARARLPLGVVAHLSDDPLGAEVLRPLLSGADGVVHLAARVHVMRESSHDPAAEFQRVNVEGTRRVAETAREAGVGRFVFMSSIKVNGENREAPYTEADVPRPTDPYGQSKLDAEEVVQAVAPGWTIFRPPLVYGPEVGGNFRRLLRLASLARRWPMPVGGFDALRSMIFVDNLADAVVQALGSPAAARRTFLVSDDHDVSVSELLQRLAVAMGGRPRLLRAPPGLLRMIATAAGREADLERLTGTLRVSCSSIRSTLGWRPPVELGDALGSTARWWRSTAGAA
jgi:nucleoside-diphosphate-sugar epimerase